MHFFRKKSLFQITFALLCIPLLILASCGASSSSSNSTSSGTKSKGVTLTVGGKLDGESKILTKLYTLELRNAGYTVNEKPAFGNNTIVFTGIKSGALDLYPEFTATGLDALSQKSSLNDQQDYDTVKAGFKKQFNIDWLNYSPLNDTYAICMQKSEAQKLQISSISDLAAKASQLTFDLPSDSAYVFDYLKAKYNNLSEASFKSLHKVDYEIGFKELSGGQTQAAFCYSTDIGIVTNNFVALTDNNHAFPAYHPAPIVRDSVLAKNPDIATVLNKLAPYLTTDASLQLQKAVLDDTNQGMSNSQAVTQAATDFLKKNKLL